MMKIRFKAYFWVQMSIGLVCLLSAGISFAQLAKEKFVYDSGGRRDPFIPLVDNQTISGLRASFLPPKEKVRLPIEIAVKGILWNGQEYFAILNDQVLKKGQKLDGIELEKIEPDKVVLKYRGEKFNIFLKKGSKQ